MRKIVLLFMAFWLCLSLACNFPVAHPTPTALPTHTIRAFPTSSPIPPTIQIDTPTVQAAAPTATASLFAGLSTATPEGAAPGGRVEPGDSYSYYAQSGDTLDAVAKRFGVKPEQVASVQQIPLHGLIPPGQLLTIPNAVGSPPYPSALLPDSEVVDSPTALDLDLKEYITKAGGFLSAYSQTISKESLTAAEIVQRAAENTSTNPRLLLALVEFRSHWVSSTPSKPDLSYPLGFNVPGYEGLFLELSLAGKLLNIGYYGWRSGTLTELVFTDRYSARLAPQLNAGSVALQYLFARLYRQDEWLARLYGKDGLMQVYEKMFGDPWARAARVEPLFPAGMQLPTLELPFAPGEGWSLTAGPHPDWNTGTPSGALDLAPITFEPPCAVSVFWARASAPGVVIRARDSIVVLDLDGDGREQTGWVLFYMHIAEKDRVIPGTRVNTDDPIGHPSCEGGNATGTHEHLARKFNGEWIGAGEPLPFILSGWTALPGANPYEGTLVKDGRVVTAHPDGASGSEIVR